jgi:hypothetical protein
MLALKGEGFLYGYRMSFYLRARRAAGQTKLDIYR